MRSAPRRIERLPEQYFTALLARVAAAAAADGEPLVDLGRGNPEVGPPAHVVEAHLIEDETQIDERWLDDCATVGVTSGASAPERLVERVCEWFRARGVGDIRALPTVDEDVTFRLPIELRRASAA